MTQAELFTSEPEPLKPTSPIGMPTGVRLKHERARSPEVSAALLEVAQARPGEWLTSRTFEAVFQRFDISCARGTAIGQLVRARQLDERRVYFGKGIGAEQPGSPNYQGFGHEYRLIDQKQMGENA